jgi:hypothetical protein
VTFLHVYMAGFACCMGLCAASIYSYRGHVEIRENLLTWTISFVLICALWPLVLIAALVAATDR